MLLVRFFLKLFLQKFLKVRVAISLTEDGFRNGFWQLNQILAHLRLVFLLVLICLVLFRRDTLETELIAAGVLMLQKSIIIRSVLNILMLLIGDE